MWQYNSYPNYNFGRVDGLITLSIHLGSSKKLRHHHNPEITSHKTDLLKAHQQVTNLSLSSVSDELSLISAKKDLTDARAAFQRTVRKHEKLDAISRDMKQ